MVHPNQQDCGERACCLPHCDGSTNTVKLLARGCWLWVGLSIYCTSTLGTSSFVFMGYDPDREELWTERLKIHQMHHLVHWSGLPETALVAIIIHFIFMLNFFFQKWLLSFNHLAGCRLQAGSVELTRNKRLSSRSFCSISKQCQ